MKEKSNATFMSQQYVAVTFMRRLRLINQTATKNKSRTTMDYG